MSRRNRLANLKEQARALGVIVVVMSTGVPAALVVHQVANAWEPVAIFISLGLGLACPGWYLRIRRRGWLLIVLSASLLGFSFTSALLHGWLAAIHVVAILLFLTSIGLVVATVIARAMLQRRLSRLRRALESDVRDAGKELFGEGPFQREGLFRDDGHRLLVYPSRRRLLGAVALQAPLVGGLAAFCVFASIGTLVRVALLALLVILMALLGAEFSRLIIRRPSLVVGPDGLRDGGSLIATGMGLLRWQEILGVYAHARTEGWRTRTYLNILVTDVQTIRRRQPAWKQLALILVRGSPASVSIAPLALDRPADELTRQIERYARTHAPPDWPTWWEDEEAESSITGATHPETPHLER